MTESEMNAENIRRLKALAKSQEAAMEMWQMYQACLSVGFNEDQAITILLKIVEGSFNGMGN